MPAPPNPPADYVSETDLNRLGIDAVLVRILCPWAVELTGHGGERCWSADDLAPLLEGGVP